MSKGTWGFSAGTKPDHRVSVSGGLQETKSGGTGKLRLKGRHTNEVKGAAAGAARTGGGLQGPSLQEPSTTLGMPWTVASSRLHGTKVGQVAYQMISPTRHSLGACTKLRRCGE